MAHRFQKFATYFLVFSLFWIFLAMDYIVQVVTGAECDKFGAAFIQLSNCSSVKSIDSILPEGVEMISTIIALGGVILSAAASFEISRRS